MASLLGGLMPAVLGNVSVINNFLSTVGVLTASLPNALQNGPSNLGLVTTPVLPAFLGDSNAGFPWGNRTASGTNYYQDVPHTGVTRYYDFTISRGHLSPDGTKVNMVLVNGQFPGPLIEANWGDYIHVTVHNNITGPEEGTVVHWHGLRQTATPWYDGIASVSQCPIAPGKTFVYNFQADLYGTSWYHSHYSAQYVGGLLGPMVIYGPTNYPASAGKVIDLGPVIVSDLYHTNYEALTKQSMSLNPLESQFALSDNTIIQGKGVANCGNATDNTACVRLPNVAKFVFTPGRTHRLRFVNTGASAYVLISMDGHDMTVIANDYVPVQPYTAQVIRLNVGQRTDVLVTANQIPGAYWLRVRQPILCALAKQPYALAAVYYKGVNTHTKPTSLPQLQFIEPVLLACANDDLTLTTPAYAIPAVKADNTVVINITQEVNATGHLVFAMNGVSFRANYNRPILQLEYEGNDTYPYDPEWNVYNFGTNETTNIIFNNELPFAHPMHIHGQNMWVLNEDFGSWDSRTVVNPWNPQRRDTQTVRPLGYLAVQIRADNPGIWPFHCHIAWHLSQGLYINVMQKPKLVTQPEIPVVVNETCAAWNAFSSTHNVDEIDSGV